MTFLESAKRQLLTKAYFQFSGRASRSEYWWFVLFLFFANIVTVILSVIIPVIGSLIYGLWSLYAIIPTFAVLCRRMHDSGHSSLFFWLQLPFWIIGGVIMVLSGFAAAASSGSYSDALAAGFGAMMIIGFVLCFVAFLFFVITFILTLMPSTPGQNKYGMPEGAAVQNAAPAATAAPAQGFGAVPPQWQQPAAAPQQPSQGNPFNKQ